MHRRLNTMTATAQHKRTFRRRSGRVVDRPLLPAALLGAVLFAVGAAVGQDTGQDEDDESKQRLIRKTRGEEEGDIMSDIMRRMTEVGVRLDEFFDAGPETQDKQVKIIEELDAAIEQARQNLRARRGGSSGKGDSREQGQAADQASDGADGQSSESGADGGGVAGGEQTETPTSGALHERQRQWGNLPQRDRDEILQSFNEDIVEKYRELINRYYEALARPVEEE